MSPAADIALQRILSGLREQPASDPTPCPERHQGEHCDGQWHYDGDPWMRPRPAMTRACPVLQRAHWTTRVDLERARLSGLLSRCPGGLTGYDPARHGADGERALRAVCAWVRELPPRRNLVLMGPLGVGKTHLLLGAHLALLRRGVSSQFCSSTDLREGFAGCASFGEARRQEAELQRDTLLSSAVLCWDDAGDVEGDARGRGVFAEGLKYLLDRRRGPWAVTTNLTAEEAARHPDLGRKVMSRLLDGAEVIVVTGEDQRLRRLP